MRRPTLVSLAALLTLGCSGEEPSSVGALGGASGAAGAAGAAAGAASGGAGAGGAGAGGVPTGGGGSAGTPSGGAGTGGGGAAGGGGASGAAGQAGAGQGGSMVPGEYLGTPFKTLQIPGTIHAADYDRGGPGVAFCHGNESDCGAGVVTGDWAPADTPVYREPMPAAATICGGAACDDNVGLCHMNASKPDNTTAGELVMPQDIYICYVAPGQWLKYTVQVTEPGTYSISGFVAAPGGVTLELDFGGGLVVGPFAVPESPIGSCGCGEAYHSWQAAPDLATVTFPAVGTYLMTLTVVTQQFNADTLVFTKM